MYKRSQTRLQSGGKTSEPIFSSQGVKQGDLLSSILFIFLIDWIAEKADTKIGFKLAGEILLILLYCDDMVLLASSLEDLQRQTELIVAALAQVGLSVNPKKCAIQAIRVDRTHKLWYVDSGAVVQVHGESFPALSISDPYKYLGLQVRATGTRASVEEQLQFKLEQVTKAPLKPQQRMFILWANILLALFHQLVLAKITEGT